MQQDIHSNISRFFFAFETEVLFQIMEFVFLNNFGFCENLYMEIIYYFSYENFKHILFLKKINIFLLIFQ